MNRWIAVLAMGLATAANAPAATPPESATHGVVSSAQAAQREEGARVRPAGLALDRERASLSSEGDGPSLSSSGPDPVIAWMLAAGFLGIIVMRRTRATQAY